MSENVNLIVCSAKLILYQKINKSLSSLKRFVLKIYVQKQFCSSQHIVQTKPEYVPRNLFMLASAALAKEECRNVSNNALWDLSAAFFIVLLSNCCRSKNKGKHPECTFISNSKNIISHS